MANPLKTDTFKSNIRAITLAHLRTTLIKKSHKIVWENEESHYYRTKQIVIGTLDLEIVLRKGTRNRKSSIYLGESTDNLQISQFLEAETSDTINIHNA